MKILVNQMPNDVSECDWANPTDPFYDEDTIWFCDWMANHHHETCPMSKGGECPYFTDMSRQSDLGCIIDAFNAVPEVYPVRTQEVQELLSVILIERNRHDSI